MGRGLSDLQQQILLIAYKNHVAEGRDIWRYYEVIISPLCTPEYFWSTGAACLLERFFDAEQAKIKAQEVGGLVHVVSASYADLYSHEVLIEAFGFGPHRHLMMNGQPQDLHCYEMTYNKVTKSYEYPSIRRPYGKFFDRTAIGEDRYNAAVASVSRAFARLEDRDLVVRLYAERQWMGISLTLAGLERAKRLSVNTNDNITSINR